MVYDLHNDILTSGLPYSDIKRIVRGYANPATIYAYWTSRLNTDALQSVGRAFAALAHDCDVHRFAIEDLWFIRESELPKLSRLPVLYCGLTWNDDNALCGGAFGKGRLTELGKKTIRALNAAHICIDTAHLNTESFFDVCEEGKYILNSHCGLQAICSHPRNLSDEQVRLLLQRKGIVGLTPVSDFFGGARRAEAFAEGIDTFVQRYGVQGLCVGTDFFGTTPFENLQRYEDFAIVFDSLRHLGYNNESIEKIFYKNAQEYFGNTGEKHGKEHL